MVKIRIHKDSTRIAKVVMYNNENKVLMLTRSMNHKKFPGELDLPGGHARVGEEILKALIREVKEETGIILKKAKFYKKNENKYFFYAQYHEQKINLSKEHTKYGFYRSNKLNKHKKFENIAIKVLEMLNDDENKNK